jgi:hypothetical protein
MAFIRVSIAVGTTGSQLDDLYCRYLYQLILRVVKATSTTSLRLHVPVRRMKICFNFQNRFSSSPSYR